MSGPCLVRTVAIFILFSSFSLLHAEDEEFSDIMELVSETENCSAKLARDKNATEEQKKEDRKRRKIGIGETVTVTLNCKKPFLLEPKDQIQWKVIEGKELLEGGLRKIPNSYHSVTFQINPCASKEQIQQSGGKVAIEVETEQGTALPRLLNLTWFSLNILLRNMKLWAGWLKAFLRQIWDFQGMEILHMEFPPSFSSPSIPWTSVLTGSM